jgi:D-alanyl-D-alanine carboxypeptidase
LFSIDGSLRVGDEPHLVKFAVANSTEYFQAEFNWFLKSKGIRFDNTSVRRCNESALNDTKASILFITCDFFCEKFLPGEASLNFVLFFWISLRSPPFGAIIQQCLLESNNLFAEMFLRHVGKWNQNVLSTGTSSVEQGLAVMRTILPKFGMVIRSCN